MLTQEILLTEKYTGKRSKVKVMMSAQRDLSV